MLFREPIYNTEVVNLKLEENKLLEFLSEDEEEWRQFPDEQFKDLYYVSNKERVYSVRNHKMMKISGENKYYQNKGLNLSLHGDTLFFDICIAMQQAFNKSFRTKAEIIDITDRLKGA